MDRYTKIAVIGKGTFGSAWLVESKLSGYQYAIKELSVCTMTATDRHLALNEVKILSTLKHKNIIRYKNAFEENSNFYIVMEYAEGGDIYSKIKQATSYFPREQVLDWFTQLLLALKHIHGLNILHRDLKTQNIFLTRSDVIKLGDFGIARILDSTTDHAQTTVGTPYYLSPEICQRQPYNQKSDMWALGCVMYEITTLKHPFTAESFSSLVVKILQGEYEPIPSEYGPLLEDLLAILLRSNPNDRPSAKQLLFVPAMKKYVEKYAVMAPREKINSTTTEPNQSGIQNGCRDDVKAWHLKRTSREQVKNKEPEVKKEQKECASCQKSQFEGKCHCKAPPVVHGNEKLKDRREKAYSVGGCREKADGRQERRTESVSCAEKLRNAQPDSKKPLARLSTAKNDVVAVDFSAANSKSTRLSILREHQKQRHSSVDSGARPSNDEISSTQDETKARTKIRSERVYSDVTGSSKCVAGIKDDNVHEKTTQRRFSGVREVKIKPKIIPKCRKNSSFRKKLLSKDEVRVRRGSCSTHTRDVKNEQNRKTSDVERKISARLLSADKGDSHSSSTDTTSSDSDEDDVIVNVTTQSRSHNYTNMNSPHEIGVPAGKPRDRTASAPCGVAARVRRRVARESLNYHMYHCRRLRAKSTKSASSETLNKENQYPGNRQQVGSKALGKAKIPVGLQEKGSPNNTMVEPTEFKRCQTYKVAQFRRLPLMSVPDATRNVGTKVASKKEISQSSSSTGRRNSDSTFLNPKLSISKFHGLRAAHIDRARRRAKRMSAAADVGSARREFSVIPDNACAGTTNHSLLPKASNELGKNVFCVTKTTENATKRKENEMPVSDKGYGKITFKFRGETLHLNSTDAKSVFAHIEALRVFLEENLGTRRFIDAYQYLTDSVFLSEKEKKMDTNIQHIMGKENLEYLPLLRQLIATETNHFGTRV